MNKETVGYNCVYIMEHYIKRGKDGRGREEVRDEKKGNWDVLFKCINST